MSPFATLATLALLAASAFAQSPVQTTTLPGGFVGNNAPCPNGQASYQERTQYYCCPGFYHDVLNNPYCCVNSNFGSNNDPSVSFSSFPSCFPFCTGSTTTTQAATQQVTALACAATIYLSDSNYNSKVSSAASSISKGGSSAGGAAATTTGGSNGGTSSSGGTGAMVTSGPIAGAVMVAGGLLLAL